MLEIIEQLNRLGKHLIYDIEDIKGFSFVETKKMLKTIERIQKYCPKITVTETKFRITESEIYDRYNDKEKLILYLSSRNAEDKDSAVYIPPRFHSKSMKDSIGYLYKKTDEDKYYLTSSGKNILRLIKEALTSLIYEKKSIDEVFGSTHE